MIILFIPGKCLHLSGLIPEPMNAYDDFKLKEFGIGFTNICARTTKGSADLKKWVDWRGSDGCVIYNRNVFMWENIL